MGVISGINGAVYHFAEMTHTATAGDIVYGPNSIISSVINFKTTGYEAGHFLTITNSSTTAGGNNNGYWTVSAVTTGVVGSYLTIVQTLSTGCDTGSPTIAEKEPGIEKMGFYNWTIEYKTEEYDSTNFYESSGGRSFISGITDWTASADKYFLSTGGNLVDWLGNTVKARFFNQYVANPETTNTAQYLQGDTKVLGINFNSPVDALITSTITFRGVGALTPVVRATAWTT